MNARRKFLAGLAVLHPLLARAQPAAGVKGTVRVGILRTIRDASPGTAENVFINTLRELGWVEGRNVAYERVYADSDETLLLARAVDLVTKHPDLIFTVTNPETLAALSATRTIPVVFGAVNDPVGIGIVKSLAHPGGNATGIASLGPELSGKRMQLLRETLPTVNRVGVLLKKPESDSELKSIEQAAGGRVKVIPVPMKKPEELDAAFAFLAKSRVGAVLLAQVFFLSRASKHIATLSMKYRIPVIAARSRNVEEGALLSYNSNIADQARRAAQLAEKVLKGARPSDLPVEQPTKFELQINMNTAKALGITIPQSIRASADRVIE